MLTSFSSIPYVNTFLWLNKLVELCFSIKFKFQNSIPLISKRLEKKKGKKNLKIFCPHYWSKKINQVAYMFNVKKKIKNRYFILLYFFMNTAQWKNNYHIDHKETNKEDVIIFYQMSSRTSSIKKHYWYLRITNIS